MMQIDLEQLEPRQLMSTLIITAGGSYSGTWSSVTVDTTAPVTVQNATISGTGALIHTAVSGTRLTLENITATGLDPTTAGVAPGQFIDDTSGASLTLQHCTINNCGGYVIQVQNWNGGTVNISDNSITDVNGMYSDGNGGYQENGTIFNHAIIFSKCAGLSDSQISWNSIVDNPGQSFVNDVINMYESSGTSSSPISIDNNFINGCYALDPATQYDSGCGITMDGQSNSTQFIDIADNTILNTNNAAIGMGYGSNVTIEGNTCLDPGILGSGQSSYGVNVGITVWKAPHADTVVDDNIVGWVRRPHTDFNPGGSAAAADYGIGDASASSGNTSLSVAQTTAATQTSAIDAWNAAVAENGYTIGAGGTATPPPPPSSVCVLIASGKDTGYSTLQAAVNAAAGSTGDLIQVYGASAGAYFNSATTNLTIEGMSNAAVIAKACSDGEDGIDAEPGLANGLTIENLTFTGKYSRAEVRIEQASNVTVSGCDFAGTAEWACYTSHNTDDMIRANVFTGTESQHAIYLANSVVLGQIINNNIAGNSMGSAIELNGDLSDGAPGICTDCVIEGNTITGGGSAGGAAINLDGVQDSQVISNTIVGSLHTGIAAFVGDGAAGPSGDLFEANTISMASSNDMALEIESPAGTNTVLDNDILVGRVSLAAGTAA
jgi:hypothetical protein